MSQSFCCSLGQFAIGLQRCGNVLDRQLPKILHLRPNSVKVIALLIRMTELALLPSPASWYQSRLLLGSFLWRRFDSIIDGSLEDPELNPGDFVPSQMLCESVLRMYTSTPASSIVSSLQKDAALSHRFLQLYRGRCVCGEVSSALHLLSSTTSPHQYFWLLLQDVGGITNLSLHLKSADRM